MPGITYAGKWVSINEVGSIHGSMRASDTRRELGCRWDGGGYVVLRGI